MRTMHHPVVSPSPDHSQHCSYLGSHYSVASVSVCLCPSADMCESVCGCVCECWCLSAEWGGEQTVLLSAKTSVWSARCLHVFMLMYQFAGLQMKQNCLSARIFKKTKDASLFYGLFPIKRRPRHPVGFFFFFFLTPGDRTWGLECPVGSRPAPLPTSHPPPLVVATLAANFPPDALNSWLAWRRKQKQLLLASADQSAVQSL